MTNSLRKQLNQLSFPLLFNSLLGMGLSLLMTAIIGRVSSDAIAATEVVDGLIYSVIGILGTGALSFNIYGAKIRESNPTLFQDYFKSILLLNLLLGSVGSLTLVVWLPQILSEVYHFGGETLAIGTSYGQVSAIKIVVYVIIFSFSNQLKVKKKSHIIAVAGVISSIVQLTLSVASFTFFAEYYQLVGLGFASLLSVLIECGVYCFILRTDLRELRVIKSGKKLFLFKKSLPLLGQECLEGALFSLVFTALFSRLSISLFAGYSLCLVVVKVAQLAMFPYANSQLILISEALGKGNYDELRRLPKLTTSLTLATYLSISVVVVFFSPTLLSLLSNHSKLIDQAEEILPLVLVFFISQLFFEVNKYSLQAIGQEHKVLVWTGIVNGVTVSLLIGLQLANLHSLSTILSGLALNYGVLGYLFAQEYQKSIKIS